MSLIQFQADNQFYAQYSHTMEINTSKKTTKTEHLKKREISYAY